MPYDTTVNSTRVCQTQTYYNNVLTTMDTCSFTLLNPNLVPVIGPVGVAAFTTGTYQFALPLGTLNMAGNWSQVWYIQKNGTINQSLQTTGNISVGP